LIGRRIAAAALAFAAGACRVAEREAEPARVADVVPHRVPADSEVTEPDMLASLRRGRALLRNTRDSLPGHVGNQLQCVSCHAMDGTKRNTMSLVGVYSRFPQYRARSGRIDLIEDRVNDCFERSMNGRPLDHRSRDMRDLVTYMAFLSRGVPAGARVDGQGVPALPPVRGDTAGGRQLFATTCAACHGVNGEGTPAAPPLWGPQSYNIGAGMARVNTAAAFIRAAMPQTAPGTLSPQQAYDLAAYINSRPRPDFPRKADDWPRGDPPPDVAYPIKAKKAGAN
jgi:thiosulfate dehydrogenase